MNANGYILKDSSKEVFRTAIREVATGNYFYSSKLTHTIVTEYYRRMQTGTNTVLALPLTKREIDILQKIKAGKNNCDLSEEYHVSQRTVEAHRLNIMRKLSVNHIEAAIEAALQKGLIKN
jgi:DNA-binding NarL/FixJ family response regulator